MNPTQQVFFNMSIWLLITLNSSILCRFGNEAACVALGTQYEDSPRHLKGIRCADV